MSPAAPALRSRRLAAGLLAALLAVGALCATSGAEEDVLRRRPQPLAPAAHGVGTLVPDLAFEDLDGTSGRLSDYRSAKLLVIAFTNASCPVCKRYGPKLARLAAAWEARGAAFLFVNPTPHEDLPVVRAARKAHGLRGRYVLDKGQRFTKALGARTTGEAFVLDAARTLVYRGAIDDQYGVGYTLDAPAHEYLADALKAVSAGRTPEIQALTAPGCVLRIEGEPAPTAARPVTWHGDVQRIVQRRCQTCHRPGESGPFSLLTYAEAKGNAGMLRYMVAQRLMPPWFASEASLPFHNDSSLTASERAQVLAWVDADCPKGNVADAPLPRSFVEGWRIGTPDAVIEIARPVRVPAEGTVAYQYQDVKTELDEDKWVTAFEIRPSAPQVVHHVLVFARYPRKHPRYREQPRNRHGLDGYFAAMVPGQSALQFPQGTARFLPKGTTLRFQLHYTTNGTAAVDRTKLGLIFASGAPKHEMRTAGLANVRIRIPAGAGNHREGSSRMLPVPARVYGFTPHMHVRGKAFRYEALLPDGSRRVLLDIPRYDFNWQIHYRLAEPLDLPPGTRLFATAWYDNSDSNPANPDPGMTVLWGNQTWEEMLIGYVDWHPLPAAK